MKRLAILLFAGGLLAGCAGTQEVASPSLPGACDVVGPVVVAAGGRSNMPAPSAEASARYLKEAARAGSEVFVVDTGGEPVVLGSVSFTSAAANSVAAQEQMKVAAQRLTTGIEAARAQTPGADPLAALSLASRQIRATSQVGTIVLVDSGLQTSGVLDFTRKAMLRADPEDLVIGLRESGQMPDLSGLRVFFVGLADVAAPQEPLDLASRNMLIEQWTAIAAAAGSSCVGVDQAPLSGPGPVGAPMVPRVAVPKVQPLVPASKVVLDSDTVAFHSDSAQLRDPAFAKQQLAVIAGALDDSGQSVLLTGTTATDGTQAGRLELSRQRAEAVKALLVELGVPSARIATRGVGTDHPEHVDDLDASGRLIPDKAARNRTVILTVKS